MQKFKSGQKVEIVAIDESNPYASHLIRMGFLPGKILEFRNRAPLGDPYIFALDDAAFMLRHEELAALKLIPVTAATTSPTPPATTHTTHTTPATPTQRS
jgi:Fe2+ transport system protein FeoA